MFQLFLDKLSEHRPDKLKVLILDNGAFHKAKKLIIPTNIALIFQPPYSPEVNAAEKMWAAYKRAFTNKLNKSLEEVSDFMEEFTKTLSPEKVRSITQFEYVKNCLNWTI